MTAAIADPLIGSVIGGRYEVIRKIARGGMGMIYEVRNLRLGRTFALKTVTAEAAQDPEVLSRFRREADVVARLSHPNIVEVVDWDQLDDGAPYLVMELLRGETLAQRIEAMGGLPWLQIARIADETLSALSVAHHAGVIHRDLKPDNIYLATDDAGDERVKLLDFGISKIRDSQTFATTDAKMLGTPAYMAPEQAEGQHDRIGPATDVWAMGAILYEMITGQVAFAAPSTPAILYRVCHGRPTPALELRADLPAELGELLEWTLDLQLRLDDVDELRAELHRVLGKLEGVTWATPMKSRAFDATRARPSGPILGAGLQPRLSTPVPIRSQHTPPAALPIVAAAVDDHPSRWRGATREAGRSIDPVLPPAPRSRRGLAIAGGALAFVAAAIVVFVIVRATSSDDPKPSPVEPAPAIATPPPAEVPRHAPAVVMVTVESTPAGAEVFRMPSELKVGTTPWTAKLEQADGIAVFVVRRAGYRDGRVEIDLRAGGTATAELAKITQAPPARTLRKPPPATPPPTKKPPDRKKGEPINPFEKKPPR